MMEQQPIDQGVAMAVPPPSTRTTASRPPKRNRHRRAATEGNFDFLYEQQKQQRANVVSVGDDLFGLGPKAPAKPDLLNAMAHSFAKEEQQRILNGSHGNLSMTMTGPTLIHADSQGSQDAMAAMRMEPTLFAPIPVASPSPPLLPTISPPSMEPTPFAPEDDHLFSIGPVGPTPIAPAADYQVVASPPPIVFASEDEMMDLAMAIEPVTIPEHHALPPPPVVQTTTLPTLLQPTQPMDMDMDMDVDTTTESKTAEGEPQPSRLSQFLDSLQVVADQQNAMLRQQQVVQKQQSRKRNRHRRAASEGPTRFDSNCFADQPAWPSFEMGDKAEDAAIFMAANQAPASSFY